MRAALLLIVLVVGWYVLGRATASSRAIRQTELNNNATASDWDGQSLRVVSYNIAHGRGLSPSNWAGDRSDPLNAIADLLIELNADIVILNEVDFDSSWSGRKNQAQLIAERAGYPWVAEQTNYDLSLPLFRLRFGNAILSRFPITDAQLIAYPAVNRIEALGFGQKQGLACTVELHTNQSVRIVAVHFDTRDADVRIDSAEAIRQLLLSPGPSLIVAGDFNDAPPESDQTASSLSVLQSAQGMRGIESLSDSPSSPGGSFPSPQPTRLIDHLIAQSPWTLTHFEVIPSQLSDHRPIVADLVLSESNIDAEPLGTASP